MDCEGMGSLAFTFFSTNFVCHYCIVLSLRLAELCKPARNARRYSLGCYNPYATAQDTDEP